VGYLILIFVGKPNTANIMNIGIYTRLSRDDEQSSSIANQLREGKAFAKSKKFNNPKIYNEGGGVSGISDMESRPQLMQLIIDIKSGLISTVWMRSANRLDRNGLTFYVFIDAVKKNDVNVYFGDGDKLNFNDPATLLQSSILSSLNQYQAGLQSIQTKKALRDSANEGKAWGVIPYAYATDENKKIVINESQAKTVKKMFDLSLEGWGVGRISTYLNDNGIPTKYNGYEGTMKNVNKYDKSVTTKDYKEIVWSAKTVLDILRNKWYIGTRIYSGVEYPTPPIIDKVLFNKVGANLVKNRNNSGKKVEYRYLLKGLLRCGKCERNYYGRTRASKNDNFYMCSSKRVKALNCGSRAINIPYLETFVIKHLFQSKDLLNHLKHLANDDNSLNELNNELTQLQTNLEIEIKTNQRLADLLQNTKLSNDQLFISRYNQSKDKLSDFKARIEAVEQRITERTNNDRIKAYNNEVETVDLSNFTKLKQAINNIIETIEISNFKTVNEIDFYQIDIAYKGFNEITTFQTLSSYHEWNYTFGKLIEPDENHLEYPSDIAKSSYESYFDTIYLDKGDLIEFN
jgi:DNA invertase Pin-like site-specific DNA recombinase